MVVRRQDGSRPCSASSLKYQHDASYAPITGPRNVEASSPAALSCRSIKSRQSPYPCISSPFSRFASLPRRTMFGNRTGRCRSPCTFSPDWISPNANAGSRAFWDIWVHCIDVVRIDGFDRCHAQCCSEKHRARGRIIDRQEWRRPPLLALADSEDICTHIGHGDRRYECKVCGIEREWFL